MSNFVEVSYNDVEGSRTLDQPIITLASKYLGSTSGKGFGGDRRSLEFLFPHFEQVSAFTAELRVQLPQVAVDSIA